MKSWLVLLDLVLRTIRLDFPFMPPGKIWGDLFRVGRVLSMDSAEVENEDMHADVDTDADSDANGTKPKAENDDFTKGAFVVLRFGGTMFLFFLFFAYVNFSAVGWKAWRVNLLAFVLLACLCVALFYGSRISRWILVAFTAYMGYRMLDAIDFQNWFSTIVCVLYAYLFIWWTYQLLFSKELKSFMASMRWMNSQE